MSIALGVTTLQSSDNKKIDLYNKYGLTKVVVTYKQNDTQSCIIMFTINRAIDYCVNFLNY